MTISIALERLPPSLAAICTSETGTDTLTIDTPAAMAASTSPVSMRHQAMVVSGSSASTMARIAVISSRPIAGVPASISGTPARASARAIATFSAVVKATPGACSPSRSVVSLRTTGASLPRRHGTISVRGLGGRLFDHETLTFADGADIAEDPRRLSQAMQSNRRATAYLRYKPLI